MDFYSDWFFSYVWVLGGIGINKPRGMSVKMWCVGYLAVALVFDVRVVMHLLLICFWGFPQEQLPG